MTKSGPEVSEKAKSDNEFLAMAGAEILLKALEDENVEVIFGYPGGAVLPIYDALFKNNKIIAPTEINNVPFTLARINNIVTFSTA